MESININSIKKYRTGRISVLYFICFLSYLFKKLYFTYLSSHRKAERMVLLTFSASTGFAICPFIPFI